MPESRGRAILKMRARNEIKARLAALQPIQDPDLEQAAALLENMSELLKTATPEELEAIFHSLLKTVYLDGGPQGPVTAIEPQPFLKLLMDVSDVPTVPDWTTGNPNDLARRGPDDGDDGGGGGSFRRGDGEFAQEARDDTIVPDAGKNHVVRENPKPVAPAHNKPLTLRTTMRSFSFSASAGSIIGRTRDLFGP
jgi:hypothetical protein